MPFGAVGTPVPASEFHSVGVGPCPSDLPSNNDFRFEFKSTRFGRPRFNDLPTQMPKVKLSSPDISTVLPLPCTSRRRRKRRKRSCYSDMMKEAHHADPVPVKPVEVIEPTGAFSKLDRI